MPPMPLIQQQEHQLIQQKQETQPVRRWCHIGTAAPRVRTIAAMTSTIMIIGGLFAALIMIQRTNSRKRIGL